MTGLYVFNLSAMLLWFYIDFQKAFDVVCHRKLFTKLFNYGIRGTVLLWLKNFFADRTRQTRVDTRPRSRGSKR